MRQTLFRIPIDVGIPFGSWELPLFGIGILLVLWSLYGVVRVWQYRKDLSLETLGLPAVIWLVGIFVIVQAPSWATRPLHQRVAELSAQIDSPPSGVPVAALLVELGDRGLGHRVDPDQLRPLRACLASDEGDAGDEEIVTVEEVHACSPARGANAEELLVAPPSADPAA